MTKTHPSSVIAKARKIFLKPLPGERVGMYVAVGSCVLALVALVYAVRIYELQRRDALLFELERHYQDYERLLMTADCIRGVRPRSIESRDLETLRHLTGDLRNVLMRKG